MSMPLQRPGSIPTARDKLRTAINSLAEEKLRLDSLEAARGRARHDRHTAQDRLVAAEAELDEARRAEQGELAYAFANQQEYSHGLLLAEKQAELDRQGRAIEQAERVEAALASEIEQAEARMRRCVHAHRDALAQVITSSPEFQNTILAGLKEAWAQIRTLRHIGVELVLGACAGYASAAVMSELQRTEPIEPRQGFDIDEQLIERWRASLAELAVNSEAELPG
jgi:hypothetical protein